MPCFQAVLVALSLSPYYRDNKRAARIRRTVIATLAFRIQDRRSTPRDLSKEQSPPAPRPPAAHGAVRSPSTGTKYLSAAGDLEAHIPARRETVKKDYLGSALGSETKNAQKEAHLQQKPRFLAVFARRGEVRDQEVVGSSPVTSTKTRHRRFVCALFCIYGHVTGLDGGGASGSERFAGE